MAICCSGKSLRQSLSPVSSNEYSSHLRPDGWLRILVLTSGRLLYAAGLIIILTLPFDVALRGIAGGAWLATARAKLRRLEWGFDYCRGIRIDGDGGVAILGPDAEWLSARLLPGSLLLPQLAWLRLETDDGSVLHELVRGDARQSQDWRRLQVIWRHIGAGRRSC